MPPGITACRLVVEKQGYASVTKGLQREASLQIVHVELIPKARLSVEVCDLSGTAINGALVRVSWGSGSSVGGLERSANGLGIAEFDGLQSQENARVVVSAHGYVRARESIRLNSEAGRLRITLHRGTGMYCDVSRLRPPFSVTTAVRGGTVSESHIRTDDMIQSSGETAKLPMAFVPPGTYRVVIHVDGVPVVDDDYEVNDTEVLIPLGVAGQSTRSLRIHCHDGVGVPLAGVQVRSEYGVGISNELGNCSITVPAGWGGHLLTQRVGFQLLRTEVLPQQDRVTLTLAATRNARMRFRVSGTQGEGANYTATFAPVSLGSLQDRLGNSHTVDGERIVKAGQLAKDGASEWISIPTGAWKVMFSLRGARLESRVLLGDGESAEVTATMVALDPGEFRGDGDREQEIAIHVRGADGQMTLAGKVAGSKAILLPDAAGVSGDYVLYDEGGRVVGLTGESDPAKRQGSQSLRVYFGTGFSAERSAKLWAPGLDGNGLSQDTRRSEDGAYEVPVSPPGWWTLSIEGFFLRIRSVSPGVLRPALELSNVGVQVPTGLVVTTVLTLDAECEDVALISHPRKVGLNRHEIRLLGGRCLVLGRSGGKPVAWIEGAGVSEIGRGLDSGLVAIRELRVSLDGSPYTGVAVVTAISVQGHSLAAYGGFPVILYEGEVISGGPLEIAVSPETEIGVRILVGSRWIGTAATITGDGPVDIAVER